MSFASFQSTTAVSESLPIVRKALSQAGYNSAPKKGEHGNTDFPVDSFSGSLQNAATAVARNVVTLMCGGLQGTVCQQEGDFHFDFSSAVPPVPFKHVVRHKEVERMPMKSSACAIVELVFIRGVKSTVTTPVVVSDFPPHLVAGGQRCDVATAGVVLVSARQTAEAGCFFRINGNALGKIFSSMSATSVIDSVLPGSWSQLGAMNLDAIPNLLEEVAHGISEYWQGEDHTTRVQTNVVFAMRTVAVTLCKRMSEAFKEEDAFRSSRKLLEKASSVAELWITACEKLCTIDFGSEWERGKYRPTLLSEVSTRLEDVLRLRGVQEELVELVGAAEVRNMRGDSFWDAFDQIDVFDTTKIKWEMAVSQFFRRLEMLEHIAATKLRSFLGGAGVTPNSVLHDFMRYRELIRRPIIAKELETERDTLLAKMGDRVQGIKNEFEQRLHALETTQTIEEDRRKQVGRYMPGIVNKIVWVRQLRFKIIETRQIAKLLLHDLERASSFDEMCRTLLEDFDEYITDTFKNWCYDVKDNLPDIALDSSRSVMDIKEGKLQVNYSERLVELLREVRILVAMDFQVPSDIVKTSQQASTFYQSGVQLKQICNVYNTMGREIIPSTRAMLYEPAMKFEGVIEPEKQRKICWSNVEDTQHYISRLRNASVALTEDIRQLRTVHDELGNIVVELMSVDLLRSNERWNNRVRSMRNKIACVQYEGTEAWKRHWDAQLYKALEHQYVLGLESLRDIMPEIKADIIFDKGRVGLRPNLSQLRANYYGKLKEFISFPAKFNGVGNSEFFKLLPGRNVASIATVMNQTLSLWKKVQAEVNRWDPFVSVGKCGMNGTPTLEQICSKILLDVPHFETHIKTLKKKGKELAKEENFIKIDCITLSTAGIKATIEEQMSKVADTINACLKRSAETHLKKIAAFLDEGEKNMSGNLQKLEEIGKANATHQKLTENRPVIEAEFRSFDVKNRLYQSLTASEGITTAEELRDRWMAFTERLDSHEKEMAKKLAKMKAAAGKVVETFVTEMNKFNERWQELKPKDARTHKPQDGFKFVVDQEEKFAVLKQQQEEVVTQCEYFQIEEPDMVLMTDLHEDIEETKKTWQLYCEFHEATAGMQEEEWLTFRSKLFKFEDFVRDWLHTAREKPSSDVVLHIVQLLEEWQRVTPMLKYLRGDGMTPDHWQEMFTILGIERGMTSDKLQFKHVIGAHSAILKREKDLKGLAARVQGENSIREALDDVKSWSLKGEFKLTKHQERKGVMLITEWKEVMSSVSDNQSLLFSLKDSPYFSPFASEAAKWEGKFILLDDILHNLNAIQRKWIYLEPIFARGALPQEQPRFMKVDKEYVTIMREVERDPHIIALANFPQYKEHLKGLVEQLDRCQRALNDFLEQKRDRFPRFYFISDDDLLEILGQSRNPQVIQSHLKKLFMGINTVKFDRDMQHITHLRSADGEIVPLHESVQIRVEVEDWLNDLDVAMKATLRKQLAACIEQISVSEYPSQVLCLCEQIHFTTNAENTLTDPQKNGNLTDLDMKLHKELKDLTTFAATNTDTVLDLKLKALIMDLIHNIDVVDQLKKANATHVQDWQWQKQLRFYTNDVCARMASARFNYSFEYQGNAPKLAHTPLTDRCYLTLTQGMHLGYGGNPYGPAGTGKTESVKALGNLLGRQVLVFNCDEGIDFKSMGRIFIGLVKCGAWGCFDEFNRLKVDQLSAISQMIQVIQEGLKNGDDSCGLLGRNCNINPNAGIFVTLNPAGKGYGGRSKLPDNLKQLFRSVAMSVPDNELIAETILYSEGFENATELAKKIVEVFQLCKQLLSHQQHYDWGLRAIKAVLRLGGVLIHSHLNQKLASGDTSSDPAETLKIEADIIIKSLRVNTLSKLTFDDVKLFNALISDIFPGVPVQEIKYEQLQPAVLEAIKDLKLQHLETQVNKVLQLYEALQQRMGVVLVGPSGSGKSTLLKILRKAMQILGTRVPQYVMNPKAISRQQLLGHMDVDTREWYDGVLTAAARNVVKEEGNVRSWIFCDGDIDPEWVENLNSVLDDNKLLTMPNGVRIQFGNNVNFIFETHSLQYASPATVSRTGIIYLSEEDVDPLAAVRTWLAAQPEDHRHNLETWISDYFFRAVDNLLTMQPLVVDTTRMGIVMSGLSHVAGATCKAHFASALTRMGSFLEETRRVDFAKDVYHLCGEKPLSMKDPLDTYFDTDRACYAAYTYDRGEEMTIDDLKRHPMVPTLDVQRNMDIISTWLAPGSYRPFVLVGPEGCGKTMLLRNSIARLKSVKVAIVNCSAQTVAAHVVQKLMQVCGIFNTNQGRVLRPKDSERVILLLKDLNLPKPDKYGTVQLTSFLQQLVLYHGFYDNDLEWVSVERVQIIGSMNPVGTMGRHAVAQRFVAIVSVLSVSYPSKDSLQAIYSEFFTTLFNSEVFQNMRNKIANWASTKGSSELARAITTVYDDVQKKFTVDQASHYIFNPRDITRWVLGVLRYKLDTCEFLDAVAYEGQRIFLDRLMTAEDRKKFDRTLFQQMNALGYNKKDDYEGTFYIHAIDNQVADGEKRLSVAKVDDLRKALQLSITQYSREFRDISVPPIPEMLAWAARMDRALTQENGNLLLVGRAGYGRRELVEVLCYQLRLSVADLKMPRGYGVKAFQADLKISAVTAGINGEHCVLLLEDHNFTDQAFLEMVNSLLSAGEVPGLFSQEELDAMLGPLKEEAANEGFLEGVYPYFVSRVQRYLHVVILMDPTNEDFQSRCQSNPALFARCNVFWMGQWSSESMKYLPKIFLRDIYKDLTADKKEFHVGAELINMHNGIGERAGPALFKTLMATYNKIYSEKSTSSDESLSRLQKGLAKLAEGEANVDTIRAEVTQRKMDAEVKQKEADEALVEIQKKMEEAGEQKKHIQKIQKEIDAENAVIEEKKVDIEQQLSGIKPVLDAAKEAVGQIRSENLSEMKALKTPPEAVRHVLEAVLTLQGKSETSWNAIRKYLGGDGVKSAILQFDAKCITNEIRAAVKKSIDQHPNSFRPEVIQRASVAAAPLAAWVKANIDYSYVLESIEPLTSELATYENNIKAGREKLKKYEDKLRKVDRKVEELKKNFSHKTKEAERLKSKVERAQNQLDVAEQLLSKLADEKKRWGEQVRSIQQDVRLVPKRALLAAGFITYLGKEPEDVRSSTVALWCERLGVEKFSFTNFLRSESTMLKYKSQGLPGDELSLDNSVVILEQVRTALIIDPANQAAEWLRVHLKEQGVVVDSCNIGDEKFSQAVELAVRFGKTLFVREVDRIEPLLYPLIRGHFTFEGPKKVVSIGDRPSVDVADSFKLFMLTRAVDLRLPPDAMSTVSEVSFTITRSGLEGQLLGTTIRHEQPELENQKVELLKKEDSLKMQLAGLEESLLRDLAQSQGSLLDDTTLVDSLNEIKQQAITIGESLAQSAELQEEIDTKRNVYRGFAAKGSIVYFLVSDLRRLNHMYQFSLNSFLKIFGDSLTAMSGSPSSATHKIVELTDHMVQATVRFVSMSLFKADRVTFGIHLAHGLNHDMCSPVEWGLLLGRSNAEVSTKDNVPNWVERESQPGFRLLRATLPALIPHLNLQESDTWYQWIRTASAETEMPSFLSKVTPFQQLLVIQALRSDRLLPAISNFVCRELNVPTLSEGAGLGTIVDQATASEPILLITTPGADPSQDLQSLAFERVGKEHFFQIALGGGQTDEAMSLVRSAAKNGQWVFLKNLHLVIPWAGVLEKELNIIEPHENFRLWMTSESHDAFPSILLSSALKVTFEAPPGVKQNLTRSYQGWKGQYLDSRNGLQSQLLLSLAWLHSVVQERRSYIPQGWRKYYEFSSADLRAAADVVCAQSENVNAKVDWKTIRGILESAIYGGQLENEYDLRILRANLQHMFRDAALPDAKRQEHLTKGLMIPQKANHSTVSQIISGLPDSDVPGTFDLPPNADRAVARLNVLRVTGDLAKLHEERSAAQMTRDQWIAILLPVIQQWTALCTPHADALANSVPPRKDAMPISIFVHSELEAAVTLVDTVEQTMSDLRKVVEGTKLLTPQLRADSDTLIAGEVPLSWDGAFAGPESINSWLRTLVNKTVAIRTWFTNVSNGNLLRQKLNLSDLFRPQTFLNALRQQASRVSGQPLVNLQLQCSWDKPLEHCALPVSIDGMLCQGAKIEDGALAEVGADAAGLQPLPVCHIGFVVPGEGDVQDEPVSSPRAHGRNTQPYIRAPMYASSTREHFLGDLKMPCVPVESDKWILAGVAIVLEQ